MSQPRLIFKEQITRSLCFPDTKEAQEILVAITMHPQWSDKVPHICPLCGFESDLTNICRDCKKSPKDRYSFGNKRCAVPMLVKGDPSIIVKGQGD